MAGHREALPQEKLGNPGGTANFSSFDLGKKHATTEIFGLLTPVEFRNIITADEHSIGNSDRVETYTLAAPLMSQVWKNKEWYQVPRMAILPGAWDLIYTQPTLGDDIDATTAGTSVSAEEWTKFMKKIDEEFQDAIDDLITKEATAEAAGAKTVIEAIEKVIKMAIVSEYLYSYGSLLNRAGCKMAAWYQSKNRTYDNYDEAFDNFISLLQYGFKVTWDNGTTVYTVRNGTTGKNLTNELSIREFLTKARDNLNFEVITWIVGTTQTGGITKESTITEAEANLINTRKTTITNAIDETMPNSRVNYSKPVDLARLWAYQLTCAEHYTDDQIDYVYNADIYRAYISDLVKDMIETAGDHLEDFEYEINGIKHQYDWMSAAGFKYVYESIEGGTIPYDYLTALFNLNRSLKFKDYFSGAKTIPIAPGDNTVAVVSNKFDVVDVANKSQAAKFRFAIKRIGRKIDEYVKGLLGIEIAVDYHYPLWIGSTKEALRPSETENTGAAQVSTAKTDANPITSKLSGYSGDYRFVGKFDRDSIVICISYYDVERLYFKGTHRSFMHVDRFDYFNQYMQFTGDQEVYSEEYDTSLTGSLSTIFGYKPAYEEFKEEIATADAGFVTALPGYAFLNDKEHNNYVNGSKPTEHIGPDFIRSKPTEMDRFYKVLTGYSLANYFHFIVIYSQGDQAKRSMVYNPNLAL